MLRHRDVSAIADLSRLLLSPLDAPTIMAWTAEVERKIRALLGADTVALELPTSQGVHRYISPETPSQAFAGYVDDYLPTLERQWGIRSRLLRLGVSSRRTLYGEHLPAYYRTPTWNELIVPNRCFDTIAMASTTGDRLGGEPGYIFLIHGQATGRKFGAAGLEALRLLYPAFRAGIRALDQLESSRHHVASLVDAMPCAVALADADGVVLHRNAALLSLLLPEEGRSALDHAIDRALRRAAAHERRTGSKRVERAEPPQPDTVTIGDARYRVTASIFAGGSAPTEARMLAIVDRFGPKPIPEEALRTLGVTVREVGVIRLARQGQTTEGIASALGISRHTARHHLESVMRKLKVRTRAALLARVAELDVGILNES